MKFMFAHRKAIATCPIDEANSPNISSAHTLNQQTIEFSPLLWYEAQLKTRTYSFTDEAGNILLKLCIDLKKNLL